MCPFTKVKVKGRDQWWLQVKPSQGLPLNPNGNIHPRLLLNNSPNTVLSKEEAVSAFKCFSFALKIESSADKISHPSDTIYCLHLLVAPSSWSFLCVLPSSTRILISYFTANLPVHKKKRWLARASNDLKCRLSEVWQDGWAFFFCHSSSD